MGPLPSDQMMRLQNQTEKMEEQLKEKHAIKVLMQMTF